MAFEALENVDWDNSISTCSGRLTGHGKSIAQLSSMMAHNQLPHGFLFHGPWGVGKRSCAFHLAWSMLTNQQSLVTQIPLYDPTFRQMLAGSYPDYFYLDGERAGADAVRDAIAFFQQTAAMGGWRVAIFDNIHALSVRVATRILKLLEEPSPRCLLILVTPHLDRVPLTLRSRSQLLTFSPLSALEGAKALMEIDPGFSLDRATALMEIAQGSPGYALVLKDFGGETFYHQFTKAFESLFQEGIGPMMNLLDPLFFKGKEGAGQKSFAHLVDFIQDYTFLFIREKVQENTALAPLAEIWMANGQLFQMGDIFNLDRRQMLIVSLTQLTQHPAIKSSI